MATNPLSSDERIEPGMLFTIKHDVTPGFTRLEFITNTVDGRWYNSIAVRIFGNPDNVEIVYTAPNLWDRSPILRYTEVKLVAK
jgi:hypothetical protein